MSGDFGQASRPASRSARARGRWRTGGRLVVAGLAVAGHVAFLEVLIGTEPRPRESFEPQALSVELAQLPVLPMSPAIPAAVQDPPVAPPARQMAVRPQPASPDVIPLPASEGADPEAALTDAQIAGAAAAGSGAAGGRACDMARRLQTALRKDPRVQAAVADAARAPGPSGQALYVWNGDWIRSPGQDGAGLAAVREAILWEVAFGPTACRAEPVHGLVLFSMADGGGAGRLVLGADEWRWSDLLHPRSRRQ